MKVYNENGDFLGTVKKITDKSVTVEKSFGSQGYQFDVKKERVEFHGEKAVIKEKE